MKHNLRSLHTNRASPSPYWRYPFAADDEVGSPLVPWTSGGTSKGRSAKADGERYVTDEQRSRRPIFNATLRAGGQLAFFCVACSTRMTQIRALRSRLEKQPTDLRRNWRLHIHRRNSNSVLVG